MTLTAMWIEHHLFDPHATGYHVVSTLLHALSAVLIWTLLKRLKVPGAWAAAALWAVHPLQVETVAWATELKNVLSGAFYFGSMIVILRYLEVTPATERVEGTSKE